MKRKPSFELLFFLSENCSVSIDYILKGEQAFKFSRATKINMSMNTASAKQALQHLNKCARSIRELDCAAYPALQALENDINSNQDPEILELAGRM